MLFDEFLDQRILASSPLKSTDRLADLAPDSVLEFVGSSLGKGHHQNLMDRKVLFQKQAQEKAGDGIGLPGPCPGLDEVGSLQRSIERIECPVTFHPRLLHRLTSLRYFSLGAEISSAICRNWESMGSWCRKQSS